MDVDQALRAATVEGFSGWFKFVSGDASTNVLLLTIDEGRGGHAGSVRLTPEARRPLTLRNGAVAQKSCGVRCRHD